jgi:hypothetical protein
MRKARLSLVGLLVTLLSAFDPGIAFADALRFYTRVLVARGYLGLEEDSSFSSLSNKEMAKVRKLAASSPCLGWQLDAVTRLVADPDFRKFLGDVPAYAVQVHIEIVMADVSGFQVKFYEQPSVDPNVVRYVPVRGPGVSLLDTHVIGTCAIPDFKRLYAAAEAVRNSVITGYR